MRSHLQGEDPCVIAVCVVEHDIPGLGEALRGVENSNWVAKLATEVLRRIVGIVDCWSSEGEEGG